MSEQADLTRRLDELKADCAQLDEQRAHAEAPLRAGFAEDFSVLEHTLERLEGELAGHLSAVSENERQRAALERARLAVAWRTARGVFAWSVTAGVSSWVLTTGGGWLALLPPLATSLTGLALRRLSRGRR